MKNVDVRRQIVNVRRQTVQDPEMMLPREKQGPRSPKFRG